MRNDARSARSTRQQLRPTANTDERAALARAPLSGDCPCNSDCFCNFLATFILWSGGKLQIKCPCLLQTVSDTAFRGTACSSTVEQGPGVRRQTVCPGASPHRPTHDSNSCDGQGS